MPCAGASAASILRIAVRDWRMRGCGRLCVIVTIATMAIPGWHMTCGVNVFGAAARRPPIVCLLAIAAAKASIPQVIWRCCSASSESFAWELPDPAVAAAAVRAR